MSDVEERVSKEGSESSEREDGEHEEKKEKNGKNTHKRRSTQLDDQDEGPAAKESRKEGDGTTEPPPTPVSEQDRSGASSSEQTAKAAVSEVHSANNWESADMGDEGRKNKFLRLMGAAKASGGSNADDKTKLKEAHASRSADTESKLEAELETNYKQTMQNHLKQRDMRHRGLGYHSDSSAAFGEAVAPEKQVPSHDPAEDPQVHFVSADHTKTVDL